METVIEITKAVVNLHNYLMKSRCSTDANSYCPVGFTDRDDASGLNEGDWRREAEGCEGLIPLQCIVSNNYTRNAKETREDYMRYFNSPEGSLAWQNDIVSRTE